MPPPFLLQTRQGEKDVRREAQRVSCNADLPSALTPYPLPLTPHPLPPTPYPLPLLPLSIPYPLSLTPYTYPLVPIRADTRHSLEYPIRFDEDGGRD